MSTNRKDAAPQVAQPAREAVDAPNVARTPAAAAQRKLSAAEWLWGRIVAAALAKFPTGYDEEGIYTAWKEELDKRLADLVTPSEWIPVGERLPDDDITVMVALKDSDEDVWLGYHDTDGWYSATDSVPLGKMVTHWRPMLEAPNG